MSDTKNLNPDFAPDFEVTFEEELPVNYDFDSISKEDDCTEQIDTGALNNPSFQNTYDEDDYIDEEDNDNDYDYDYRPRPYKEKRVYIKSKKKRHHYGTKNIYKNAYRIVRFVSALITAGTFFFLLLEFWRGSAPYGDPLTMVTEQNYTLASYCGFAFLILLYEFIIFFWSLTKVKFKVNGKTYREDHGRGLTSFIFLYIISYLSFLLCSFLPEHLTLGRFDFLNGLKGALDVFGSMHNILLGLCVAGVASCIARKHMS